MARYNLPMIDMENLTSLELLKTHCLYSDQFAVLPKDRQTEIYRYCRSHATWDGCLASLEQIRYAVTHIYFGEANRYYGI